ncbi:hypothetical protein ACKI1Z_43670, partial [Streptomyces galilaeus]|uniref:hypothetical protein n=1 Tax=Streptomyces galilaeus TaxID=33899 RepID=UPI0038F80750
PKKINKPVPKNSPIQAALSDLSIRISPCHIKITIKRTLNFPFGKFRDNLANITIFRKGIMIRV